jgi:hypothetical protein
LLIHGGACSRPFDHLPKLYGDNLERASDPSLRRGNDTPATSARAIPIMGVSASFAVNSPRRRRLEVSAVRRGFSGMGELFMADFRKLSIAALLADGKIDDSEVKVIKKELYADGRIDRKEVEFLIELRNAAQKKAKGGTLSPAFESLFFKAVQDNVLEDGVITAKEAGWLRKMLYADKKIDENEKKFLKKLKSQASKTSPVFDALYNECLRKK